MSLNLHQLSFQKAFVAVLISIMSTQLHAFPEPELTSSDWEFEFKQDPIRTIAIRKPEGGYQWFWYITYSVMNNSGEPQIFAPDFTVMMDDGNVVKPNHGIGKTAFKLIKERVNNTLLETPVEVVGTFLPGRDHIKESVIIWKVPTRHTSRMTLFIGGLSGEVQRMTTERSLQVTDITSGKSLFKGPLVYESQRNKLPRAFDRKVKWMDLKVEKLKKIKPSGEKIIAGSGRTADVIVKDDRWVVSYQDEMHKIELIQLKKGQGQILRKQLMIDFELPGRPVSPQQQTVLKTSKLWVMR